MSSSSAATLEWASIGPSATAVPAPRVEASAPASGADAVIGRAPVDESFSLLSLLSPAFYATCFDVDAADVAARVRAALWPFRPPTPFLALIAPKPDLYGPVWLAATLVFCIGAGSNFASWLNFSSSAAVSIWQYDFRSLTRALVFVYGFAFLAPAFVWAVMAYTLPRNATPGIVTLTCVYGYSVAPFIPAAVRSRLGPAPPPTPFSTLTPSKIPPTHPPLQLACVIPSTALQWLAVLAATIISAAFTLQSTYRSVLMAMAAASSSGSTATSAAIMGSARALLLIIVGAQLLFGVFLKFYFFSFS